MKDREDIGFVLVIITIVVGVILIAFINGWENDFKSPRQLCEENGGVYIEDLSPHHQNKCMYGLKGDKENG